MDLHLHPVLHRILGCHMHLVRHVPNNNVNTHIVFVGMLSLKNIPISIQQPDNGDVGCAIIAKKEKKTALKKDLIMIKVA
jgi:hypothetical protein